MGVDPPEICCAMGVDHVPGLHRLAPLSVAFFLKEWSEAISPPNGTLVLERFVPVLFLGRFPRTPSGDIWPYIRPADIVRRNSSVAGRCGRVIFISWPTVDKELR